VTHTGARRTIHVFCAKNGVELDPDDDDADDLVVAVASGERDDVDEIAAIVRTFVRRTTA
jgi:death-on-curing protein